MPDGWVRLAGKVIASSGTIAPGATLFTLDAQVRPNRSIILPIYDDNGTAGSVSIAASGIVTSSITLTTSYSLQLDAVSFKLNN